MTNEFLGTDLALELRNHELRPVYVLATERRLLKKQGAFLEDLALLTGRDNLGQAVLMRLLTPRGELSALAHPDYGSRLGELIGRPNTDTTRNLVKLYILEALAAEPRIEKVVEVKVEPVKGTRDTVTVALGVKPVGAFQPLSIGPFELELGA